jgi:hypothetical protein
MCPEKSVIAMTFLFGVDLPVMSSHTSKNYTTPLRETHRCRVLKGLPSVIHRALNKQPFPLCYTKNTQKKTLDKLAYLLNVFLFSQSANNLFVECLSLMLDKEASLPSVFLALNKQIFFLSYPSDFF